MAAFLYALFRKERRIPGHQICIYATTLPVDYQHPKSNLDLLEETQRVCAQFLLTDLNAALTFLDIAEFTDSADTRQRNREHALAAYQTVLRLLPRISPSDDGLFALREKLQILKARLLGLGIELNDETGAAPHAENRT